MTAPGLSHAGGATNKAAQEVRGKKTVIEREAKKVQDTITQLRQSEWKAMASVKFDATMNRWQVNSRGLLSAIEEMAVLLERYNRRLVAAQSQTTHQVAQLGQQVDGSANYSAKMFA